MKQLNILSIFLFVAFLFTVQTAKAQYSEQQIFSNDLEEDDEFGESVGISGDYLISGARIKTGGGAAYIFYNNNGTWEQHTKLTYENAQNGDRFGNSVCISGDYAVVTATGGKGYAIMYHNNDGTWEQQQIFEKPELQDDEGFGASSDIDGNNFILGLRPYNSGYGKGGAFIYNFNGTTWTETAELIPAEAVDGDIVGENIAINGDYVIISSHGYDDTYNGQGAAYIYKNIAGTWTQMQQIISGDPQENAYFGVDVAINDNYAIVGALTEDIGSQTNQGAVYVFENNADIWTQTQKIIAPDGQQPDMFGCDIDFNDNLLAIGSRNAGTEGAVYIYENIDETWTFAEKIEPSNGSSSQYGDLFGDAVDIDANTICVGAHWYNNGYDNQGAAYIYSPAELNTENDITNFDVPNQVGEETIDDIEHTVTLDVEAGTDVSELVPTIEISTNATIDPASGVSQDFTTPVEYTVTAENGNEQIWTITVTILPTNINDISQNNFIIYPNPSNGIFVVKTLQGFQNLVRFKITDITGKIIYITRKHAPLQIENNLLTIDLTMGQAPLQKGIYFINIQTETNIYTQKIIIN